MIHGFEDTGHFLSLDPASNLCFAKESKGFGGICTYMYKACSVAVFTVNSEFCVFDPHAHDGEIKC